MEQSSLAATIQEQTRRALWEVRNVMDCIPAQLWERCYCEMPMWKHVYHMLHSLDKWMINPRDDEYREPSFHEKDLNNLDVVSQKSISKTEMASYFDGIQRKIMNYVSLLRDSELLICPPGCEYTRFTLILAQFRHLHSHMGMLMGFLIDDLGRWPRVLGLEGAFPKENDAPFF